MHGRNMSIAGGGSTRLALRTGTTSEGLLELYARSRRPVLTEREQVEVCLFGGSGLRD